MTTTKRGKLRRLRATSSKSIGTQDWKDYPNSTRPQKLKFMLAADCLLHVSKEGRRFKSPLWLLASLKTCLGRRWLRVRATLLRHQSIHYGSDWFLHNAIHNHSSPICQ